jgi:hypothetical protein
VPLTLGETNGLASAGTPLPAVPPYNVSLTGGYTTLLANDWSLDLSANVTFVGGQDTKLEENGTYTIPGFGSYVVGTYLRAYDYGNIRAELKKGHYSFALYVNNLWNNTRPIGDDNYLPVFGQALYYLQPRTIGAELAANF